MRSILITTACLLAILFAQAQTDSITTIAVIGCHDQHKPAPALPYFADVLKPNYAIWVGDNVYADTETDPAHIQKQLDILGNKDGFARLRDVAKFMVTWDDHDYGLNDAGKYYALKEQSKQIHRKFWGLESEISEDHDGVYYAKLEKQPNGKVIQFIMLDGRSNRDNPKQRNASAFGEKQWNWLEEQLKQPADVRFIVNGYQILLKHPTRWEALIKLGKSRNRLIDMIKTTGAQNIVFVTGDQHYVEVLRSPWNVKYHTYEIMAAGINKNERPGFARNRVAGPDVTIHSAPIIEVHWDTDPYIVFKNYDVEGNRVNTEYRFLLSDIKWKE